MRWAMVVVAAGVLVGCASDKPVLITPNSRLIYHDGAGHAIWTTCDRGNRVYITHKGPVQVIPNGCLDGAP